MASYHCSVKTGGKGRAGKHSDYIEREGKYSPELAHGKSKLEDLEHKASGNMPKWAEHEAGIFWRAADEHERANGATYREIEVALPRELNPDQRIALVQDFIKQQIGDRHPFTFAIHIPKAAIEKGDQPHAHIMYSERTLDGIARDPDQFFKRANSKNPEKGGCKKDSAGTQERLLATRELWAKVQNAHLEKAGCEDRVSHLSLKARGIDRAPEKHLGPADAKKINAPALVESRTAERELSQARTELSTVDVTAELAAQARAAEQAREAIRQAQQTAAAAEQARAAAAEKAAAEVAREQQIKQQHAAAQAAHDLATAEKATQEKENDRIRDEALSLIDSNVAAASRAGAATGRNIEAADRASDSNRGVIESSRCHLVASSGVAGESRRGLESALQGAERRVARSYLESSVTAVRDQLGRIDRVLQQASRIFTGIVSTVAAAAQAVTRQIDTRKLEQLITQRVADRKAKEVAAKVSERPQQAAKSQVSADVAKTEEKPPKPAQHPEIDLITFHTAEDKELAERTKALYVGTTPPGEAQRAQLANDIQTAIREAVATSRATEPKCNAGNIDRDTKAEHNREAARAGQMEPWPQGQSNCALLVPAANAKRDLSAHIETGRPLMFGRKEYDDRTAALTRQHKAIEDAAKTAETRLAREVAQRVEAARQQDAQNAPKHAHAELRIDSLKALEKIATRERSVVRAREMQKPAPGKTREHDRDHGRNSGGMSR